MKVRDGEGAVASVRGTRAPHCSPGCNHTQFAFGGRDRRYSRHSIRKRAGAVLYCVMRIWTIGHSTRTIDEFISLLTKNEINLLADVRTWPGSKRYPQFNKEPLAASLNAHAIRYEHFPELGGKRKPRSDSKNTAWRNASFRGYADYMETEQFRKGVERLLDVAGEAGLTAIMCAEAVWWRCHRSLIADYLKVRRVEVMHILDTYKTEPHPFTSAARIVDGELSYR
jgi:uncharacterized protein (DUF488 family)